MHSVDGRRLSAPEHDATSSAKLQRGLLSSSWQASVTVSAFDPAPAPVSATGSLPDSALAAGGSKTLACLACAAGATASSTISTATRRRRSHGRPLGGIGHPLLATMPGRRG